MSTINSQYYPSMSQPERRELRLKYVEIQKEICCYCKASLKYEPPVEIKQKKINWRLFPPNFLRHPVHLHHCHNTGMTIGAVHAMCNAVLWQYHGE